MATYRIPLLLTTAVCVHKCLSPPTPTVSRAKWQGQPGILERIIMFDGSGATKLTIEKVFVWTAVLAETAIVLARAGLMPNEWNTRIFLWLTGSPVGVRGAGHIAATLPLSLIAGSVIAVAGTGLRLSAYQALDHQFTYQLTLKDDHQLITSFPYNIVRHPSYTGWFVCEVGLGLTVLSNDGWMRNVVIPAVRNPSTTAGAVALAWVATTAATMTMGTLFLMARTPAEDDMLKERFGKEWEKWAKRVPCRLLPFLW